MSEEKAVYGDFDVARHREMSHQLFQKELSTTAGSALWDQALVEIERLRLQVLAEKERAETAGRERDAEIVKRKAILMELSTIFDSARLCDDPSQQQKYGAEFMRGIKHALEKDILPAIRHFENDAEGANDEWGEVWHQSEIVAKQNVELLRERDEARAFLKRFAGHSDSKPSPFQDQCRYCSHYLGESCEEQDGVRTFTRNRCDNPECLSVQVRNFLGAQEGRGQEP